MVESVFVKRVLPNVCQQITVILSVVWNFVADSGSSILIHLDPNIDQGKKKAGTGTGITCSEVI